MSEVKALEQLSKNNNSNNNQGYNQLADAIANNHRLLQSVVESQNVIAKSFDDFKQEIVTLKRHRKELQSEFDEIKCIVIQLENELDKYKKAEVANNMIVMGIPWIENENIQEVFTKLKEKLQINVDEAKITSVKRLFEPQNKNGKLIPPIRIIFSDFEAKQQFFKEKNEKKLVLKSTDIDSKLKINNKPCRISLRDELTPKSMALLNKVREVQEKFNIKYIWPGRGGVILIRRTEKSKILQLKTRDEVAVFLQNLKATQKDLGFTTDSDVDEPQLMDTHGSFNNKLDDMELFNSSEGETSKQTTKRRLRAHKKSTPGVKLSESKKQKSY